MRGCCQRKLDMKAIPEKTRLVRQAYWLIKLRWMAAAGVCLSIFFTSEVLGVSLQKRPLYGISATLFLYNVLSLLLLKRKLKINGDIVFVSINKIINFQISLDLLALTALLHYSGGVENPFVIYFVFHMAIASILLSRWQSYLQASFAVGLFACLALFEHTGVLPHYCLKEFVVCNIQQSTLYVIGTIFAFASALYLVVYLTGFVSMQLRRQEEAYRQANLQLKQKDRIKDEYVSRVTHDIKGHLAAIQNCLDVVVNNLVGPLNNKQAEFVGRAHSRTVKLTTFVKMLLRLTQMRFANKIQKDVFPLKNTVDNAIAHVRVKAETKSISLNCDIEPSVDKIFGNQFSIEEAITNLLLNAVKYTPKNGVVTLKAGIDGRFVIVEIVDTGIGIPEEEITKVFDEFYRAGNAREVEQDGTGLGLSLVKQIVERNDGKIWVESQLNVGTKFSITLPKGRSGL